MKYTFIIICIIGRRIVLFSEETFEFYLIANDAESIVERILSEHWDYSTVEHFTRR